MFKSGNVQQKLHEKTTEIIKSKVSLREKIKRFDEITEAYLDQTGFPLPKVELKRMGDELNRLGKALEREKEEKPTLTPRQIKYRKNNEVPFGLANEYDAEGRNWKKPRREYRK